MLILMLILNFAVSWFNCWSVGRVWNESRALGGGIRFMAWCGAIQAAIGFSSVVGFILGAIAYQLGYLPMEYAQKAVSLWYLLIIVPALGTGLCILIESWILAFRERSIANMGVAAYNTLAMAHNFYSAIDGIPKALGDVADLFEFDTDDPKGSMILLVVALVLVALASGIMLTVALIKRYAGTVPLPARAGHHAAT